MMDILVRFCLATPENAKYTAVGDGEIVDILSQASNFSNQIDVIE
jgi:hypothetical protein